MSESDTTDDTVATGANRYSVLHWLPRYRLHTKRRKRSGDVVIEPRANTHRISGWCVQTGLMVT